MGNSLVAVERMRALTGPNIYGDRPVLVAVFVDTSGREGAVTPETIAMLRDALPLLRGLERPWDDGATLLRAGMSVPELAGSVALELLRLAGLETRTARRLVDPEPFRRGIAIEIGNERATRFLVEAAAGLVNAAAAGEAYPVEERLAEARRIACRTSLGPSTRAIVEAAERRGIPWVRQDEDSLVQLGQGVHRTFVRAALTGRTSQIAVDIACDKALAKGVLERASIPVPRGVTAYDEAEAVEALASLGAPVAVKPLDGNHGNGVSLDLEAEDEVRAAFRLARGYSSAVIVEKMFRGRDYRVLVVAGRVVAASERVPAHVVGDGVRSVAELVEIANRDPRRGEGHDKVLTRLEICPIAEAHLAKRGWGPDSVPGAGEVVYLLESANLSKGGTARDVTDDVAPEIACVCERAARIVGLDVCGVDMVLEDIARAESLATGGIIELNAAPGLRMHCHPSEGRARDVGDAIVATMFGEGETGRIPVVSITGTNGKTTVTRMVDHVLRAQGVTTGMATSDGIFVGGREIARGDTTGPASAHAVLSDPTVEVAVLETARGGILRRGLGYDWSDVGVITNVRADHIGQDGIESVDDVLQIKSLVAERVREGGTLVLNADDERLARLASDARVARIPKRIVYFSMHEASIVLRRHVSRGGTGYFVSRDGWIVEASGGEETRVARAADFPATLDGAADYQVANVLAAFAACRAQGVAAADVAAALRGFENAVHNAGRASLYRVGQGYAVVGGGHNPDAYRALARTLARWEGRRVTGLVAVPADRPAAFVEELGRAAARAFDRLVVVEDAGGSFRQLERAARDEAPDLDCSATADEGRALDAALAAMSAEDVLVVLFDESFPVLEALQRRGAKPVDAVPPLARREAMTA